MKTFTTNESKFPTMPTGTRIGKYDLLIASPENKQNV